MPIKLNNLAASKEPVAKVYDPSYFHKKILTGCGKSKGFLSVELNPKEIHEKDVSMAPLIIKKYNHGKTKEGADEYEIPMASLPNFIQMKPKVDFDKFMGKTDSVKLGEDADYELCFKLEIENIHFLKATKLNEKLVSFKGTVVYVEKATNTTKSVWTQLSTNPIKDFTETSILTDLAAGFKLSVDMVALGEYLLNFSTYENVKKQSEIWQTKITDYIEFLEVYKTDIVNFVQYLESYAVSLEQYASLHKYIKTYIAKELSEEDVKTIIRSNTNLLIYEKLSALNDKKASYPVLPSPDMSLIDPMFSVQQKNAITAPGPLSLIQAGAGSGKTTVIAQRLDYMKALGVDLKDVIVTSFTNAAADNMVARYPEVKAMTIAKMIHTIYTSNFNHELTTIGTLYNTLKIYKPKNRLAQELRGALMLFEKDPGTAYSYANILVEDNLTEIIELLNDIRQTTLELEILITYNNIKNMKMPDEYKCKHLIIDEVQDNSLFEFIFAMHFATVYETSIYFIGDVSQTLYEFRAANPKALTAIETSGCFDTYKLTTNYRSNQEILDMANIILNDIDANKYAKIQLQSNSLDRVTKSSMKDKVMMSYRNIKKNDLKEALPAWLFSGDVVNFIMNALSNGEQVAFLAYANNNMNHMQKLMEEYIRDTQHRNTLLQNVTTLNIGATKVYTADIFSKFIANYWKDISLVASATVLNTIKTAMLEKAQILARRHPEPQRYVNDYFTKWYKLSNHEIQKAYNFYCLNKFTKDEFLNVIIDSMLKFEIEENAMKQRIISDKEKDKKNAEAIKNANFIFSTVHSAKGLEFDNVIVLFANSSNMSEESKRMYYVALTRAKKRELIMAYDNELYPYILKEYEALLEELPDA